MTNTETASEEGEEEWNVWITGEDKFTLRLPKSLIF